MARYIDAEPMLKEAIEERKFVFAKEDARRNEIIVRTVYKDLAEFINNQPTADVVEVVRCEECEHSREIDRSKSPERYFNSHCIVCECEKVVGDEPMIYPKTHFCSYGKRSDT